MDGTTFSFALKQRVAIAESGETGTVVGRYETVTAEPQYFVRYLAADGRAVESWWTQSALVPDPGDNPILARYLDRTKNPMAGVELKAADVSARTLAMVDTGGGGGVDEAKPAIADDAGAFDPDGASESR